MSLNEKRKATDKIKISVVIPTYNREKTIMRCLSTVLDQTYQPFEIIIVDDGSLDNTLKLIKEIKIDKIKVVKQNHKGAQAARNAGIRKATGEWIAFQDSDDTWEPDKLEKQVKVLEDNEETIIYTDCYVIRNGGKRRWNIDGGNGNIYSEVLQRPFPMFQGMLVKKAYLEEIGLLDEDAISYQEWETSIRLAKRFNFHFINLPLFNWIQEDQDTISSNMKKDIDGWSYIVSKHKDEIVRVLGYSGLAKHYWNLLEKSFKSKNFHCLQFFVSYLECVIKSKGPVERLKNISYNLYERNVYLSMVKKYTRISPILKKFFSCFFEIKVKWEKEYGKKIYFSYLEVPITTRCSLRCKECCNLIQYYKEPYDIPTELLIQDIKKLADASVRIDELRILGGEPLLHKELQKIILGLRTIKNIIDIQIVTNGTVLPDEELLGLMQAKKISMDISNYGRLSINRTKLIELLDKYHIKYIGINQALTWSALGDISDRKRSIPQLKKIYGSCHMDCISLLNGELHVCPRSSHGKDIGIISAENEYVDIRKVVTPGELNEKIFSLLNIEYVSACNFCDANNMLCMPLIKAAEQISKATAVKLLNNN